MVGSLHCTGCGTPNDVNAKFCRKCGSELVALSGAPSGLDWKWIGLGVLVMFGTNFGAGFLLGIAQLTGPLTLALVGAVAFVAGGFLVGRYSEGKTILEPALSAVLSVGVGLLVLGKFSVAALLLGGLLPFGCALLGGWLGEKAQGTI